MSTPFVWHNGRIKPWADANVHVSTHALHYGSSVFEGERVYATPRGPAYFRLAEHTRRTDAEGRRRGMRARRYDRFAGAPTMLQRPARC